MEEIRMEESKALKGIKEAFTFLAQNKAQRQSGFGLWKGNACLVVILMVSKESRSFLTQKGLRVNLILSLTGFLLLFSGILDSVKLGGTVLVNSKFHFRLWFDYHPDFPGQICFKTNKVDIHCVFIHIFMVPVSGYSLPYTKKRTIIKNPVKGLNAFLKL